MKVYTSYTNNYIITLVIHCLFCWLSMIQITHTNKHKINHICVSPDLNHNVRTIEQFVCAEAYSVLFCPLHLTKLYIFLLLKKQTSKQAQSR